MKKLQKFSNLILVILSITLFGADYAFIDTSFAHNYAYNQSACSNNLNDTGNILSDCHEDDNYIIHSNINYNFFYINNDLTQDFSLFYFNCYLSSIWQPPKFS